MSEFIWQPTPQRIKEANITRLMKTAGVQTADELIKKSQDDIEWFWDLALKDLGVQWQKPYSQLLKGGLPFADWFIGGQLNIIDNILDRHLNNAAIKNKTALIWEGDCGAIKKISYSELNDQVSKLAGALNKLGLRAGDSAALYMPMVGEMLVSFLALLKIGVVIVPIFSGFGPEPAAIRIQDAQCKIVFTTDGALRRGKKIQTKQQVDLALQNCPSVKNVIVAKRLFEDIPFKTGFDIWYDDLLTSGKPTKTATLNAEDKSLIIYTSGTTGKPKGTLHTHAGVLAQVAKEVTYNMDCKSSDVFFWVTDIGWMMGPWEIIGTLFTGATLVLFEGAPDYPKSDRLWDMIERHKVSILGISPTAIRMLKKTDIEHIKKHDLSSLRILGSTGESWDPDSYQWYFEHVGSKLCPIINISGGTEIMGCHLAPLPIKPLKPCTLGGPGLGMAVDVFNEDGQSVREEVGYLVCKKPAPSMTKGFLNDKQRYLDTYFSKWPTIWNHGDWAYVDADGYWFLRGRADDVIKVSGHRTGPAEIESALMNHDSVAECAAIGIPHPIKGESIVCFTVLKEGFAASEDLKTELKKSVATKLGKTLTPDDIKFIAALPKTRSSKIVRGAIKKRYLGLDAGDISSIENPEALKAIKPL